MAKAYKYFARTNLVRFVQRTKNRRTPGVLAYLTSIHFWNQNRDLIAYDSHRNPAKRLTALRQSHKRRNVKKVYK